MIFLRTTYLWIAVICFAAGHLGAQEAAAPLTVVQQVEAHNAKGLMHYEKEEFPEAVSEMLLAYHLIPEPALLYNVARIYHKMNEQVLAQQYYRKFVGHEDADPANVKQALAYIQEIEKNKKQQEVAQKRKEQAAAQASRLEQEQQTAAKVPAPQATTAAQKVCLPCWLSLGMATGTLGVGATTGYLAQTQKDAFNSSFNENIRVKAAHDGAQYALLSDVSWVSAGVLTGVAGVLFYRHATQDDAKEPKESE